MSLDVSPPLMAERVLQSRQEQTAQEAQIRVMKKGLDMQESTSAALLNSVAGNLPLASNGPMGTKVNTLV